MIYFCDGCEKIVSVSEVLDFTNIGLKAAKEFGLEPTGQNLVHRYKQTVNAYKHQRPDTIGYCPVEETVFCGKVREPTDHEYFIYHTCKTNS
jgi:hypothetical protein